MSAYTYITTNKLDGVLYIGVTNDLYRRITEHKSGQIEGFSKKYKCNKLVWYQKFDSIIEAIEKEKQLKNRKRKRKIALIEESNPDRTDLAGHEMA